MFHCRASESVVEPQFVDRDVNVNGRRGSLTIRTAQTVEVDESKASRDNFLPSTSSSISNISGFSSTIPNKTLESPTSSITNLIESNVMTVLKSSSEESLSDHENSNVKESDSRGSFVNHSLNISEKNNSSKLENGNIKISVDRNTLNFNKTFCVNGNRRLDYINPQSGNNSMAAFRDNTLTNSNISRQRERQLEALKRQEERLRNKSKDKNSNSVSISAPAATPLPSVKKESKSLQSSTVKLLSPKMAMFILDISRVLTDECFVSWLPVKSVAEDSPDDMILYTLVLGNGELIMFGGIQKDAMSINHQAQSTINITNIMSNSLHFISPPRNII